jgi:GTP-binding protein
MNTLYHLRFRSLYGADRGRHGEGSNKTGRSAEDLVVPVPLGTQVFDREAGEMIGELLTDGQQLVVAAGGRGGRGNARFASATNRAPRRADPGEPGIEKQLRLELKLLADVGLIGLPNAGKSTFVSAISAARPKIADYPFTTLSPNLGVVARRVEDNPFVVADLPGLIDGAAEGAGLGLQFLRHVDRCRILLHLIDLAGTDGSVIDELTTIEKELGAYDSDLLNRPRLIVGTKLDAAGEERREEARAEAETRGLACFEISSVTGTGVDELIDQVKILLDGLSVE